MSTEKKGTQPNNLAAAMIQAQMNMPALLNVADNPYHKSKYAPLSEVESVAKPSLNKAGIAVFEAPSTKWEDGKVRVFVSCRFVHAESGEEWAEEISMIPATDKNGLQTPQAIGSAMTYARRYLLMTMAGLASQDDDGNDASQVGSHPQQQRQNYPPKQRQGQQAPKTPPARKPTPKPDPVESLDDAPEVAVSTPVGSDPSPFEDPAVGATANTTIDTKSSTFNRFMAGGKGYYGDGWEDKRKALVSSVSKGRTDSATELTIDEVKRLIVGIEELADAETPA